MANQPPQQNDTAVFCPKCSSALIEHSVLSKEASCGTCKWKGQASELLSVPFSHDMGGRDQVALFFSNDFKTAVLRPILLPLAQFLMKWGFIDKKDPKLRLLLNRYITALARGMIRSILEERAALEKEKAHEPT